MYDHATAFFKSCATRAKNETDPHRKAAYERHAARWKSLIGETPDEYFARSERESLEYEAQRAQRPRKVVLDIERIARYQPKRSGRRTLVNRTQQEARAERQRLREAVTEARRQAKRNPLPPLPY